MKEWSTIYDNTLELYHDIQKTSKEENIKKVSHKENLEQNQIHFNFNGSNLLNMENEIHCYYPEKIMRSAFKDYQILDATHDKSLWS
jgi:hypothetical protein